eukprot:TRINITY_DN9335_c0_g1_i5.p6 TRINITY_DN9335_c0_g1~~TRINITY_DN9335_c0_g1_i5.p6  ORF type:complete len:102 (-),score=0.78 TRINITY_DN9335_c0_g1_i5:221-526(-)
MYALCLSTRYLNPTVQIIRICENMVSGTEHTQVVLFYVITFVTNEFVFKFMLVLRISLLILMDLKNLKNSEFILCQLKIRKQSQHKQYQEKNQFVAGEIFL